MRALPISVSLLLVSTVLLTAQSAPRRPALPPGEDTCDAGNYYRYGVDQLHDHADRAAAGFYWAQRLAPHNALAYYAQRVALLKADPELLRRYIDGDSRTLRSAKVRRIDSLQLRAIILDPYFPPVLEEFLAVAYFTRVVGQRLRSGTGETPRFTDDELESYVRVEMERGDSATRAWLQYARGGYRQAADYWAVRLRRDPRDLDLRLQRARALVLAGLPDSARVEVDTALAASRRADAQTMAFVYDSKALWEYELGRIHERRGDRAAARDAYQRALVEDLSFHPAHFRLAYVAILAADTATAVSELERAIEIQGDDYSARLFFGMVRAARGEYEPATEQLRRAVAVEPWVAHPHFLLADVRQKAGDRDGAAAEYRRFLSLAARNDPSMAIAQQRLTALSPAQP